MLYCVDNGLPAMGDHRNRSILIIAVGEILHFIIYSGGRFGNCQQAMVAFNIALIVIKAALGMMRAAVLRKAEDLEWFELPGEPMDKLPEMVSMIGFW